MQENLLEVIQEGRRWVVVNKPAGIATERHFTYDTVEARAQVQWKRPKSEKKPYIGIVHRLDRPVSGALILALNKSSLVALNAAFANQATTKTYWALTDAPLPAESGTLKDYLMRDAHGRKAVASKKPVASAKESILNYKLLRRVGEDYLYEISPITGRFHQIRVQLAASGAPIIGDEAYGSTRPAEPNTILLHARSLVFPAPTGEEITVVAPLPESWPDGVEVVEAVETAEVAMEEE